MAHCLELRSHKCLLSSKKSGPCSFLPIGYSGEGATNLTDLALISYSSFFGCLATVPVIIAELSIVKTSTVFKLSLSTSAASTITCTKPAPSLNSKNHILPDERRFATQPLSVTSWPSCLTNSLVNTCAIT